MIARQLFFSGHVQGVGFRYSTLRIAQGYPISGFVRNLSDGRVELQIKGAEEDISALINHIRTESRLADHIRSIETNELEVSALDEHDTFKISS